MSAFFIHYVQTASPPATGWTQVVSYHTFGPVGQYHLGFHGNCVVSQLELEESWLRPGSGLEKICPVQIKRGQALFLDYKGRYWLADPHAGINQLRKERVTIKPLVREVTKEKRRRERAAKETDSDQARRLILQATPLPASAPP